MRYLLALVFAAAALLQAPAHAQRIQTQAELDALLAPVALQQDGVLWQILDAATHPQEVLEAAHWSRANPGLSGEAALRAVEGYRWHPSVKALVAFPELLARMAESPRWLAELGDAFLTQQAQVMDTVQVLRTRAHASGHLRSDAGQVVEQYDGTYVVRPAREVVYVPYYDPLVVYGPWAWPHRPVHWAPWRSHAFVGSSFFIGHSHFHRPHRASHDHLHVRPQVVHRIPHGSLNAGRFANEVVRRVPESRRQPIVSSTPQSSPPPQPRVRGQSAGAIGGAVIRQQQQRR